MNNNIITLNLSNHNIPLPIESRNSSDSTFVSWGVNNQYPVFLLDLYNQSAVHNAIINQKASYIMGAGLKLADGKELDLVMNAQDNLTEFSIKVIKDYLLFNAFAVEVIFNKFKEPIEFHHVPFHKLRTNKSKNKFWFCDDWLLTRKYINYDRYNVTSKEDAESKIYFFDGYFPSINNVYTVPEYSGTIKSILTDIQIKEFNLNNIQNHFSPSTIITFFNGNNVTETVKKQIVQDIEDKFKGASGKKFIVDFQHKDSKAAEIKQLSANDWDKAYIEISNKTVDDIMIGHQVQNPSLFGIKTSGQLGSTQELEISYEMFKNNYVNVKRLEIESALNNLFTNYSTIGGKLKFADKSLFTTQLSDATKEKVFTINELREVAGMKPLPNGNRLLNETVPVTNEEVENQDKGEIVYKKLKEEDYDKISHLGNSQDEFEIIEELEINFHQRFDKQADVSQYIIDNNVNGLTEKQLINQISKELNIKVSQSELNGYIEEINKSGIIKVNIEDGKIKTASTDTDIPEGEPDSDRVFVMYKYVKRDTASGQTLLPTSRSFCKKVISNNRLYSRSDIQEMGSIFGYDVFKYAGGFYFDPVSETTTPYCRHAWQMVRVKRKA